MRARDGRSVGGGGVVGKASGEASGETYSRASRMGDFPAGVAGWEEMWWGGRREMRAMQSATC